jgi:hypothetical protein
VLNKSDGLRATIDPNSGLARWDRRDNDRTRRRRLGIGIHHRTRTNAAAANDDRRGTILRFTGILLFYFHGVADWALGAGSGGQRPRARPALPRLPLRQCNCHRPVSIRGRAVALQANGMFFLSHQSFAGIFGVRHAYRGQQPRSTLLVSPSFLINYSEVVNTTILSFWR